MVRTIGRQLDTLSSVVKTLLANDIPGAVGGACAVYARGGPLPDGYSAVQVLLRPADAPRARAALLGTGLRAPDAADESRILLYDRDVRVDLLFRPNGHEVSAELLARADRLPVGRIEAPVVTVADLLIGELLVLDPHRVDFTRLLHIARELRAQVDWPRVHAETAASPYARAFLGLLDDLGITAQKGS